MLALVVTVCLAAWFAFTFNRFINRRQMVGEAWSGIDVQLKRRHDLIPQLVDVVKGYRDYERQLVERVTTLRTQSMGITTVKEKGPAETELSRELHSLLAVAEAYPDLKANQQFLELQRSLVAVEDEIQLARRYYNGAVRDLNILVESFPSKLVASVCGIRSADYFELESPSERATPSVSV